MWQVKISDFFSGVYRQLVKEHDSPQHIALGFGLGVFLGILPGTGPIAALGAAYLFRVNKAAALLGSVLTNTWLSVATFFMAIRVGAAILGLHWAALELQARDLIHHFSWKALFDVSIMNIIKPLLVGYAVVGFVCGVLAYLAVLLVLRKKHPG